MIYTDHQPYLFGHAGYWSKVLTADVHIAMFDVAYRQEDHLMTGNLGETTVRLAVHRSDLVRDLVPLNPARVAKTLEQTIGARRHDPKGKLEPFIELFRAADRYDWDYERLWLGMASLMKVATGSTTKILVSKEPPVGATTLARNIDRLEGLGFKPKKDTYLAGPALLKYRGTDNDPVPHSTFIHTMNNPSPVALLALLATDSNPMARLLDFSKKEVW